VRHRTDKVAGYTYDSGIMLSTDSPKLEAEGHCETFEVCSTATNVWNRSC